MKTHLLLAILTLSTTTAGAQAVRGVILQSDSLTPASGILVELVDTRGNAAVRVLSDHLGAFSLRAAASGTFQLRALRIGYRPTTTPAFLLTADSTLTLRVVLGVEVISLGTISVSGRTSCRTRGEAGEQVALVWEEARKALAAASLTSADRDFVSRVATFERAVGADQVVTFQRTTHDETREPRVFLSLPADSLARVGYVTLDGSTLAYFGPDADVLMSDAFISTHCLRLAIVPGGDSSQIALAFEPSARRRGVIDVRGILVLDRRSAELRYLVFEYVGLPGGTRPYRPGGRVEFARVAGGAWFVARWLMRMPVMEILGSAERNGGRRPLLDENADVGVLEVREAGGELLSARTEDSLVFVGAGRRITGVVRQEGNTGSPAGARVYLTGTNYEVPVDSGGTFALLEIVPGRYRLSASNGGLDSLGFTFATELVDVRDGDATELTHVIPSVGRALLHVCGAGMGNVNSAMIRGVVRDADGSALPRARILLQWTPVRDPGDRSAPRTQKRELAADESGAYRFCGVPRGADVTVQAIVNSGRSERLAVRAPFGKAVLIVDVVMK